MRCPRCHAAWSDDLQTVMRYCGACGSPLGPPAPPIHPSPHPVDSAPSQPARASGRTRLPGGELRYVVVLFADLAGYTTYAEDRAPDDVARVVGDLLQELGQIVEQSGGAVDKFLGDAVMATFGHPRADARAAHHAVRAGLLMQERIRRFCRERELPFQLRVGIHAGEVMLRDLGQSFTVMGDAVNTANRIQGVTPPGKVWCSQPVYDEARRFFNIAQRPAMELRGKRHTMQLFEVVSERPSPLSESPRFVGREREWATLLDLLAQAEAERALRVAIVRGPAGVGKSRLVTELCEWLQRQEQLYRLDVIPYDGSVRLPSHGLNALLRRRFFLPVAFDVESSLQRLREGLRHEHPTVEAGREELAVELFAFVLGTMRSDFRTQGMDGKGRWEAAFIEIKQWLEGWAAQAPWILVLEDAHKGDADTAAFIEWALGMPFAAPVLVVATLRDEDFGADSHWHGPLARLVGSGRVTEMRLRELPFEVLAESLRTMGNGIEALLARRIAEHAEGNPLFATELVLHLRDRGLLDAPERWQHVTLPSSVREVMEARLERLGPLGKEVAKRGALMGRRFTREAVARVWDRPEADLDQGFQALRETETIYEEESRQTAGELEAVFRHGRLQEAALAMIPRRERLRFRESLEAWARGKLAALGSAWEGAGALLIPPIARSLEEHGKTWEATLWYEILGLLQHAQERRREAAEALRLALQESTGTRRMVLRRLIAGAELFAGETEHALATTEAPGSASGAPEGDLPDDVREKLHALAPNPLDRWDAMVESDAAIALDLTRASVLGQLGRVAEAWAVYQDVEERLRREGDGNARLWLSWASGWIHFLSERAGRPVEAEEVCRDVRARFRLDDPELTDLKLAFLHAEGYVESRLGRFDRAESNADERLRVAAIRGDRRIEREAWNSKGIVHYSRGELGVAGACMEKALEVSRAIGDRTGEAMALHNIGLFQYYMGKRDEARDYQMRYMALSRAIGNRLAEAYGPAYLGAILMDEESFDAAEAQLAIARRVAEENGWLRLKSLARAFTGEARLRRYLSAPADGLLADAVEMLRSSEDGWSYYDDAGELYAWLALALHLSGDGPGALAAIDRARARTHESFTVHRVWVDLAEALLRGGSIEEPLDWFRRSGYGRSVAIADGLRRAVNRP